jgi:hypothetical protein
MGGLTAIAMPVVVGSGVTALGYGTYVFAKSYKKK